MPSLEIRIHPLLAYDVWRSMHKRCKDPKTNGYKHYGGRGISVCEEWSSYEKFIEDMGARPSTKHQLDRCDNEGDYNLSNCRWVTAKENENKKDKTRMLSWAGKTQNATEWAKELGFSVSTFFSRLNKWGEAEAFSRPHGPTGPKRQS